MTSRQLVDNGDNKARITERIKKIQKSFVKKFNAFPKSNLMTLKQLPGN